MCVDAPGLFNLFRRSFKSKSLPSKHKVVLQNYKVSTLHIESYNTTSMDTVFDLRYINNEFASICALQQEPS